tara:strand:+ start:9163 stop:9309 length:147 start_codon:yes stop_codon:yes gene_type:complete
MKQELGKANRSIDEINDELERLKQENIIIFDELDRIKDEVYLKENYNG